MEFVRIHKARRSDGEAGFASLTDDPADRFAFVAPASAIGADTSGAEILELIGFRSEYVREKIEAGFEFSAIYFAADKEDLPVYRADWAGLRQLLADKYANVRFSEATWTEMMATSFDAHMAEWNEARKGGKTHVGYFNYDRTRLLGEDVPLDALMLRRMLFFEFGIRDLFRGDGYAWSESGAKGVEEYLVENRPRNRIRISRVVPLVL